MRFPTITSLLAASFVAALTGLTSRDASAEVPIVRIPRLPPDIRIGPTPEQAMSVALDKSWSWGVGARDMAARSGVDLEPVLGLARHYLKIDPDANGGVEAWARIRPFDSRWGGSLSVGAKARVYLGLLESMRGESSVRAEVSYGRPGMFEIGCRVGTPCDRKPAQAIVEVRDFAGNVTRLLDERADDFRATKRSFWTFLSDPRPAQDQKVRVAIPTQGDLVVTTYLSGGFSGEATLSITPVDAKVTVDGRSSMTAWANGATDTNWVLLNANLAGLNHNDSREDRANVHAEAELAPKRRNNAWAMCAGYGANLNVQKAFRAWVLAQVYNPIAKAFHNVVNEDLPGFGFAEGQNDEHCVAIP